MDIEHGHLKLDVTDFGPIVEAKIDLRPLTVFVGPSNTGKSYLAVLIYALHRFFGRDRRFPQQRYRGDFPFYWRRGKPEISGDSLDALLDLVRPLENDGKLSKNSSIVLPLQVAEILRSGLDGNADALVGEISRCFGVDPIDSLTRRDSTSKARVVARRRVTPDSEPVEHVLTLARRSNVLDPMGGSKFQAEIPANVPIPANSEADYSAIRLLAHLGELKEITMDPTQAKFVVLELLESVGSMILPSILGPIHLPAYYLPADRTGIMHAHNVVISALIASSSFAGLRSATRTPMLSGVLADFLEQLIEIGAVRRKSKVDLGKDIEKYILGGSVGIQRESQNDYPHFVYRPNKWQDDLALANASSMVSELAPVVLYLRHIVEPGNVLIVEEPESHLHPAMQVAFTRQLSALVNAGIRVIVTTHSEWLLEELANIVRRSKLSESERRKISGSNVALNATQVGAWLFEPKKRPKGSVIREIHLDDSGLYPSGYDEIAAALHNDWAELSSRIEIRS